MSRAKQYIFWLALAVCFAALVYFLPRFLIVNFGERSPWIGYLYTYGVGSFIFLASLFRLLKVNPEPKKQTQFWLVILSLALLWGLLLHGFWIFFSITLPFKG